MGCNSIHLYYDIMIIDWDWEVWGWGGGINYYVILNAFTLLFSLVKKSL